MPFHLIGGEPEHSGTDFLPWAEEYSKSNPDMLDKVFPIQCVKLRPKGMILETQHFSVFFFKSSRQYKYLIPLCQDKAMPPKAKSVKAHKQSRPSLLLVKDKPFAELGMNDDDECVIVKDIHEESDVWNILPATDPEF